MARITTFPVYSKLANLQDIPDAIQDRLPDNLRLSEHQLATYHALTGDADVIFNTAMTGDGKSLAGLLPMLVHEHSTVSMYPTNELIRDQLRQSALSLQRWNRKDIPFDQLDAQQLDVFVTQRAQRRAEVLRSFLRNHELVLTNPDIFHYIMQQYYVRTGQSGDNPDHIIGPFIDVFQQWTFDEFHIFQTPQVVAVIIALLFIREFVGNTQPKKFLFLSATPGDLMMHLLERAEFRVEHIQGQYVHTWQQPYPEQWRRILHGIALAFSPQRAEEWVENHGEETLLRFFQEHHPAAKGALIVNSVASAQRLVRRLTPVFATHGFTVASNTGFDATTRRQESYAADLLIGTSTIDVGVDFQINFLIFESLDAGSFLQRFGRLGRHTSFEHNGVTHHFEAFEAHALLPPWIQARLFDHDESGAAPPLHDGMELDRERLSEAIRQAFPSPATFAGYGRQWGSWQAAAIIRGLYHPRIKAAYDGMRQRLAKRYQKVLRVSMKQRVIDFPTLEQPLAEEIRSFRGSGNLQCGVIDLNETGAGRVKTYDLFGLLANFHCTRLERETFEHEAQQWQIPQRVYKDGSLVAYFQVSDVRDQRNNVQVTFNQNIDDWGPHDFGVARVIKHIEVDTAEISLRLQRSVIALFCLRQEPQQLARRLRLPMPFPLYPFRSRDGCSGSIAFGRQALLLEVALQERPDIPCGGELRPMIS